MPDSVRMADLNPLSRGLENFRHLDPEERVLEERLGTQAAAERLTEAHKEVPHVETAPEAHVGEPSERQGKGRRRDRRQPQHRQVAEEPLPEREEGHLLDIQV